MKDNDQIEVSIKHVQGMSMRFSEGITKYLLERKDKKAPFYIGHWISSLSDDSISQIRTLAQEFFNGDFEPHFDDLVQTSMIAFAAETHQQNLPIEKIDEWVNGIASSCALESFKRRGLIEIHSPLSMRPDIKVQMSLTELGKQQGSDFFAMRH